MSFVTTILYIAVAILFNIVLFLVLEDANAVLLAFAAFFFFYVASIFYQWHFQNRRRGKKLPDLSAYMINATTDLEAMQLLIGKIRRASATEARPLIKNLIQLSKKHKQELGVYKLIEGETR